MLLHYKLASLNLTLSVSNYVTTNVTAEPPIRLHKIKHGYIVVSHKCSC